MHDPAPDPIARRLRRRGLIAVAALALLALAGLVQIQILIGDTASSATAINVAGRQRMLSQRVAKNAAAVRLAICDRNADELAPARAELQDALDLWTDSHRALTQGDPELGLTPPRDEELRFRYAALQADLDSIVDAARALLDASAGPFEAIDVGAVRQAEMAINQTEDRFLPAMHTIVNRHEAVAHARFMATQWAEKATLGGMLLALGLLSVFVLGPAIRELESHLKALADARAAADGANRTKSAFLANMSHEIRTPLTAILGYTEVMIDRAIAARDEERLTTLESVDTAGKHLLSVINDILDVSKIEADRIELEHIAMPLPHLLLEVESLIRPRMADGVPIRTRLASAVPGTIKGDPVRLRQILLNLAGNAAKFTSAGEVVVEASARQDPEGSMLRVDVIDTGAGMSEEAASRLFRPFTQADASVTRTHGGTGLGLTISRRLARLMGGDVAIAWTREGEGTCFRLEVPVDIPAGSVMITDLSAVDRRKSDAEAHPLPSLAGRILLAEDGLDNQRLVTWHLERAGAQVAVAGNGRIALTMIERAEAEGQPYDLLITDVQMPELDGCGLARILRERGSRLAAIAFTAHAMPEERDRCLAAGCDDMAGKPIDRRELLETCARWLGRPSSHAPAAARAAA
jgi:signal transduction histidine kinase/CheY-like chemotaxis protein